MVPCGYCEATVKLLLTKASTRNAQSGCPTGQTILSPVKTVNLPEFTRQMSDDRLLFVALLHTL